MATLGFCGLGLMGGAMAKNLAAAGHQVKIWNRSPEKAQALAGENLKPVTTPAEAAEGSEAVFTSIADDGASEQVWLGENGAMSALPQGGFVIELSTVSHNHVAQMSQKAKDKGLIYIDCPVNGMPPAAVSGDLVMLVGAETEDLEKVRPWLDVISASIVHFGGVGTGTAYKLLNNLLGAVHVASIAEAVNIAHQLNIDPDALVAAVESGPIASPHVKRMIRPMAENRLSDSFGLAIGLREKDTRYCLEMVKQLGSGMSVGETSYAWYKEALATVADQDDSAMLSVTKAKNGKVL